MDLVSSSKEKIGGTLSDAEKGKQEMDIEEEEPSIDTIPLYK